MRRIHHAIAIAALAVMVLAIATPAGAQQAVSMGPSGLPEGQGMDLTAGYGWMWGGNIGGTNGTLRVGSGNTWFFAFDFPVRPGGWLELSYTRQNSELNWEERLGGLTTFTPMSVNYWQIGAIQGIPRGNIFPYASFSLGATYYSPENPGIYDVPGTGSPPTQVQIESATKFSMIFGVGAKAFFGEAKRLGIRVSFRVFSTLYNTGGGLFVGTGGVSAGLTGNAVWSYEVMGGLVLNFPK